MVLIRAFVAIFRYVVCCGEDDRPESHWGQQRYHYSEIRDHDDCCSYPSYETRRTTVTPTPPSFTPQSKVSKPTSSSHRNVFRASLSSSTNELSSFPPPPVAADKPTPTTITSTSLIISEVLRQPRSFSYSSPASRKASEVVSTKPRDSLPPFPASHKAGEVSTKPTDSIFLHSQGGTTISGKRIEVSKDHKCFQYSSSPSTQKASEVSTKQPRDSFSSLSVSPKQNEVSKMSAARSLSSSAMSAQVNEASHTHSFKSSCSLSNIKTNITGENKSISAKCPHQLSPSASSQSSQNKFSLSNTAKPPPPSPNPTSSFPAHIQKKPSLSTKPALRTDSPSVKFPPPPPVTANKPTPTTITSSSPNEVFRQPKSFGYSSPTSHKANEGSTKPRDLFSSSSVTPKQNEVSKMQSFSSSALSPEVIEAAHTHSFNTIIKTNTTGENKGTTPKCSHHLSSSSPSSQLTQNKLLLSNTARLPPPPLSPSPNPTSSFPSPIQKKLSLSTKPALRMVSAKNHNAKNNYIWVEKGASSTYAAPDDLKGLIEKNIEPQVLMKPLSISTYKDYFRALLYAEDIYIEKWDGFEMKDVTLELHDAAIYNRRSGHNRFDEDDRKHEKRFVAFEIDKVPERRPFLISRDFVTLKPSKKNFPIFEGLVYRVVRSNLLLSEFGEDFLYQHHPTCKYDVKFSFNRVCLKRAHQAIESASGPLFKNFLFPEILPESRLLSNQYSVIDKILRLQASPPYLVKRELSVTWDRRNPPYLSGTGHLIADAVVKLIRASPLNRVLLCAPANKTCDLLLRGLIWMQRIPEHDIFRANAAFREREEVPEDILPSCTYEEETECFFCPSLDELCRYKVILSTFMSSHRLHNEGLKAGHFSHVILVDASSVTEPEALVPLANFTTEGTAVVVFGAVGNHSRWIRSPMAREFGLERSYFERLYNTLNDDDC